MATPMEDDSINTRCDEVIDLHALINQEDVIMIHEKLSPKSKSDRKIVVDAKLDGNTALFAACLLKNIEIMRYFLQECDADPDLTGIHIVEEDDSSRHVVPPIWSAAIRDEQDMVKLLLEFGANVNGCSDTKSTAVRAACYGNHLEMVKLLVANGANINIPNVNGATCLMNAIECVELCEFLLEQGADVNARETGRDQLTSLHYAVNYQKLDSIEVLIKNGADVNLQTIDGTSPIMLAALLNLKNIVKYFQNSDLPIPILDKIHALELLGTKCVDYSRFNQAIVWWKKGMKMREEHGQPKVLLEPKPMFKNALEFSSVEELDSIGLAPENFLLQSLLIKERILGHCYPDVLLGALQYAWELRGSNNYKQALVIMLYCYDGFLEKSCFLFDNCIIAVSQILNLAYLLLTRNESNFAGRFDQTSESDVTEVVNTMCTFFQKLVSHVEFASSKLSEKNKRMEDKRNFQQLLLLSLDTIMFIFKLSNRTLPKDFCLSVVKLIQMDPRTEKGETLFHIAVCRSKKMFKRLYESLPPLTDCLVDAVKILLECGANGHATDLEGNNPLHFNIEHVPDDSAVLEYQISQEILNTLLQYGVHLDTQNSTGESPLDLATKKRIDLRAGRYISLKCLAATSVAIHKVPYEMEIPLTLVHFVRLHEPPKCSEALKRVVFSQ